MGVGHERNKEWGRISKDRFIPTAPRSDETEEMAYQAEKHFGDRYGLEVNEVKDKRGKLKPIERADFLIDRAGAPPLSIDVKWTKYEKGSVLTWPNARVKADVYVLVVGPTPKDLWIRGWTVGKEHRKRLRQHTFGKRHVTYAHELREDTDQLMKFYGHPPLLPEFDPNDYPRSAWDIHHGD